MDRIDLIKQFGNQQAINEMNVLNDKTYKLNQGVTAIKALAPRMKEIYKVAVACLENGIALAPRESLRDTRENCFITNGWSHYVGLLGNVDYFSGRTTIYNGFGKKGGGACCWNLEVDLDGNITKLEGNLDNQLEVVTSFVKGFNSFEENFYTYVDKVVGNC